jgi:very-short-patch-repair endonuclease/DNA polymerase III delta prime subunit
MQDILSKLEASRKELLDLSLHNPLLNYRPLSSRGVTITGEHSADVYDLLVREGKSFSFAPKKEPVPSSPGSLFPESAPEGPEAAIRDTVLQTAETETTLQSRLLNTYYAARTSIEEQGVNILYLALGMLHWYETDSSEEVRRAPIVLVPVLLERSTARERFRLRYTLEEVGENLSLQAKLKAEFGLRLPDLPEDDEPDIERYFDAVGKAIVPARRWKVVRDEIALGFFSFGKFMIFNDLDNSKWPEDSRPVEHPVILSLFRNGFTDPPPTAGEDAFIDRETNADELFQVVDADSSQVLAMLAVQEGRNLVIQGPPGTGKSQTITNIIANAIGQRKKVLFVAEKLAALEVVKRRLDSIHLGDACLELHSHKANKKELHQELRRVMELGKPALQHLQQQVALLDAHKEELNGYCAAVNADIQNSGLSAHKLAGLLIRLGEKVGSKPLPRLSLLQVEQWDAERMQGAEAMADRIQARLKDIGVPGRTLFWGSELRVLLPHEQETLSQLIIDASAATSALQGEGLSVSAAMGLSVPATREEIMQLASVAELASRQPDLRDLAVSHAAWLPREKVIEHWLQSGERLSQLHAQYEAVLIPEAWGQDLLPVRQELVEHGEKWYKFLIGSYKKAVKQLKGVSKTGLPKENNARLQIVDAVLEARRLEEEVKEESALAHELFGVRWQKDRTDWAALKGAANYLTEVHRLVAEGKALRELLPYLAQAHPPSEAQRYHLALIKRLSDHGKSIQTLSGKIAFNDAKRFGSTTLLHQPLALQLSLLETWQERIIEIHQAISWNNLVDVATTENLQVLTETATHWDEAAALLKAALQKTWYEYLLEKAIIQYPSLRKFERNTHEEVMQQFRRLDVLNLQYNRARAALQHWEGMPETEGGGQVSILRTEFNRKARHLPIRKLMKEAGLAIQAIKPVFMMSPLSIANFLPPGALEFDLVIFDEASQVRPVDALGALLRGKQVVVVGDTKQLPPTSFFDSLTKEVEDEENVTADLQSILGMCDAQGAPQRMLRWHYRSRHESLINLSNHQFYDNRLVVFPSPGSKHDAGLKFHHLKDTVYDRGASRTNPLEAERVADAVLEHARKHPRLSLGVVAFSTAQRQAIQDALEIRRKQNPDSEAFFKAHPDEPFFVKNLENVQGDERDVIFISIGYGRTAEGYVSMSFGPLNNEGGERRLNVLITRAKLRCEVFTNLTSADLDTARTKSQGIRALKSFLHFAQHGQLDTPVQSGLPPESPFEEAVSAQLSKLGYQVHTQVGSKGFYLDLAIVDPEHPGRYILGIECDGAAYHSARSARDRDRLRQQVLEAIGWKIHRVWSTDWFRNPERELKRVVEAINKAWKSALDEDEDDEDTIVDTAIVREGVEESASKIPPYQAAQLPEQIASREVHLHPVGALAGWVEMVVQAESPVHFDEVAKRIVEAAGITRVGPRIREHIKLAIRFAEGSGRISQRGEFLWHTSMQEPVVRDRSGLPPSSRKLKYIAPEEIQKAVEKVVRDSVAIHPEAAFPLVARLLGFSRVTEDMRNDLLQVIEQTVQSTTVIKDGELLKAVH